MSDQENKEREGGSQDKMRDEGERQTDVNIERVYERNEEKQGQKLRELKEKKMRQTAYAYLCLCMGMRKNERKA